MPKWNTISISGYHIREAGSTAVQEVAFTLADGIAYVDAAVKAGLDVDAFAGRLSFFFNAHNDFFEEVAKFRAARRLWARVLAERFGGYHIREAGSTAVQELAFTLADGIAYVEAALQAGLDVDAFAGRLSFFFNAHNDLLEEVAKFRAARRLWARIMKERFKAKDPRSMMLRFHTQTAGSTLTAQQPQNNVVRVALQALAAVPRDSEHPPFLPFPGLRTENSLPRRRPLITVPSRLGSDSLRSPSSFSLALSRLRGSSTSPSNTRRRRPELRRRSAWPRRHCRPLPEAAAIASPPRCSSAPSDAGNGFLNPGHAPTALN